MQEAGVNNLDLYAARLVDTETNEEFSNYKAVNIVNIIGLIPLAEAQDMNRITAQEASSSLSFLDARNKQNLLLFHMAESEQTMLVHKKLAEVLLKSGFEKDLSFDNLPAVGFL